ncbi:MAG: hypothetical protein AAFR61_20235 [Bacteroidota bacterium]
MKIDPKEMKAIIEAAAHQAGLGFGGKDFDELSSLINAAVGRDILGDRYLYAFYKKCELALKQDQKEVGLNENYLNAVLKYLGFLNLKAYRQKAAEQQGDPRLAGLKGNWYSIVRQNSGLPYLLVAPVHIWQEGATFWIKLVGPSAQYVAKLARKENAIFTTFLNDQYKVINLIFHIGGATRPQLLMGVFSGLSTSGDTIAGRELLLRTDHDEAAMNHLRIPLEDPEQWPDWLDGRIFGYFEDHYKNCLKGSRGPTFSLDDLDVVA